jgi:hypothetical protein
MPANRHTTSSTQRDDKLRAQQKVCLMTILRFHPFTERRMNKRGEWCLGFLSLFADDKLTGFSNGRIRNRASLIKECPRLYVA